MLPARAALAIVPEPEPRLPDLRESVASALDAMTWLTQTEEASKTLALKYADQIERAQERVDLMAEVKEQASNMKYDVTIWKRLDKLEAMCDLAKVVGWLGPQLQGVLRDLGGTPAARKALQVDKPIGGRLAQLRKSAARDDD